MAENVSKTRSTARQVAQKIRNCRSKFFENYCNEIENTSGDLSLASIHAQHKKSLWCLRTIDSNLCLSVKLKLKNDEPQGLFAIGKVVTIVYSEQTAKHDGYLCVNISDLVTAPGAKVYQLHLLVKHVDLKFADATTREYIQKNLVDNRYSMLSLKEQQRAAAKSLSKDLNLSVIVRLNPTTPAQATPRDDEGKYCFFLYSLGVYLYYRL